MVALLIGRTDIDGRTFTKSGVAEIKCAGKVRRNNDPQEISHLIVKTCGEAWVAYLVTKTVTTLFSCEVPWLARGPVFA